MLAEGGWIFKGDVVIVVEPSASNTHQALDRAVEVLTRYNFRMNVVDRRAGYVRTAPRAFNDTLEIRLNALITDSMSVEVAGEVSRQSDGGGADDWNRITWQQHISRGEMPWNLMADVAGAIGSISNYDQDPTFDSTPCGGRRCAADEACREYVCIKADRN